MKKQLPRTNGSGPEAWLRPGHEWGHRFGWQNLGGELASPPAAVSWGPDRVDVFAMFKDGALWHRWFDGKIWNEWESLGGHYLGEPAVASLAPGRFDVFVVNAADQKLHHYSFSDNTWSSPRPLDQVPVAESATVVSPAPNRLEVFAPGKNRNLYLRTWDGQAWQLGSAGATIRLPSRYRLSVDFVKAITTRALNADTDAAAATLAVGNRAPRTNTQWIGKIGGATNPKQTQTNLLDFEPVTVDLAEAVSFGYLVVNNGHADQEEILTALAKAGDSLNLASVSSTQEDIAKGIVKFVSLKIVDFTVPVLGSIVGKIESWLLDKLSDALFERCDGIVAIELRAMMGRDLFIMTDNGRKTVRVTTRHPGTHSPTACGANSDYEVIWTISPR